MAMMIFMTNGDKYQQKKIQITDIMYTDEHQHCNQKQPKTLIIDQKYKQGINEANQKYKQCYIRQPIKHTFRYCIALIFG